MDFGSWRCDPSVFDKCPIPRPRLNEVTHMRTGKDQEGAERNKEATGKQRISGEEKGRDMEGRAASWGQKW